MRKGIYFKLKEANNKNEEEAEKLHERLELKSLYQRRFIFFLIILVIGLGAVFLSETILKEWEHKHLLRDTFLALSAVGLVELLNLFLLSDETETVIEKSIRKNLPSNINRIRLAGITDFNFELDVTELKSKIRNSENCHIKVLRMRFIEFEHLKKEFEQAIIHNNCTLEIILLTPYAIGLIEKRIKTLPQNLLAATQVETFQQQMFAVIQDIQTFRFNLLEEFKSKIILRLHNSLVTMSLTGFDHEWKLGFFLLGQDVVSGSHLSIKGSDKSFQKAIYKHYSKQRDLSWAFPFEVNENEKLKFLKEVALK